MRARWQARWRRGGAWVMMVGLLRSVVLVVGGGVGLALGHVGTDLGALVLGGVSWPRSAEDGPPVA
jgi:hypothetical protein